MECPDDYKSWAGIRCRNTDTDDILKLPGKTKTAQNITYDRTEHEKMFRDC